MDSRARERAGDRVAQDDSVIPSAPLVALARFRESFGIGARAVCDCGRGMNKLTRLLKTFICLRSRRGWAIRGLSVGSWFAHPYW